MARRLSLTASRLVVSLPGYDAATTDDAHLVFSTDANVGYNGVFLAGRAMAGAFSEAHSTVANGGNVYTRTCTIGFGRTFPNPPRLYFGFIDPNDTGSFAHNSAIFETADQTIVSGHYTGASLEISASITTTDVTFKVVYLYYTGSGYNRNLDIPYIVFQV